MLPEGWGKEKLGKLVRLNYGKGLPLKKRISGQYPVYGSNGIVGFHNKYLVDKGGIIVGRKGSAGRIHYSQSPFYPIDTTYYITQDDTSLNLGFLFFLLGYYDLSKIKGDVGVPGLNREMAYTEMIIYPSLPEQLKISKILSKIQSAIETQEKIIKTATELKKALMEKLFTEGLRSEPQKDTEIGKVPRSWEVIEFGQVCEQRKETVMPDNNGKNKYVGLEHIKSGEFRLNLVGEENQVRSSKFKFYAGDILYGKLRPYLDKAVLVDRQGICSADIIVLKAKKILLQDYLIGLVHTNMFMDYTNKTTSGVNHPRTSWSSLKKYRFGLPKDEELEEIGSIMQQLENKLENSKKNVELRKSLFQSLLHQLMTGQIRVNNINL